MIQTYGAGEQIADTASEDSSTGLNVQSVVGFHHQTDFQLSTLLLGLKVGFAVVKGRNGALDFWYMMGKEADLILAMERIKRAVDLHYTWENEGCEDVRFARYTDIGGSKAVEDWAEVPFDESFY